MDELQKTKVEPVSPIMYMIYTAGMIWVLSVVTLFIGVYIGYNIVPPRVDVNPTPIEMRPEIAVHPAVTVQPKFEVPAQRSPEINVNVPQQLPPNVTVNIEEKPKSAQTPEAPKEAPKKADTPKSEIKLTRPEMLATAPQDPDHDEFGRLLPPPKN